MTRSSDYHNWAMKLTGDERQAELDERHPLAHKLAGQDLSAENSRQVDENNARIKALLHAQKQAKKEANDGGF